jgi:hypothetical protein
MNHDIDKSNNSEWENPITTGFFTRTPYVRVDMFHELKDGMLELTLRDRYEKTQLVFTHTKRITLDPYKAKTTILEIDSPEKFNALCEAILKIEREFDHE